MVSRRYICQLEIPLFATEISVTELWFCVSACFFDLLRQLPAVYAAYRFVARRNFHRFTMGLARVTSTSLALSSTPFMNNRACGGGGGNSAPEWISCSLADRSQSAGSPPLYAVRFVATRMVPRTRIRTPPLHEKYDGAQSGSHEKSFREISPFVPSYRRPGRCIVALWIGTS